MYRLTFVLGVLCVGGSFAWWGHDHDHGHHMGGHRHGHRWHHNRDGQWEHDRQFEKLASAVIDTDQYSQTACKQYSNVKAQEVLDFTGHKIIYTVDQCDSKSVTIQIKHRVIYMRAQKPGEEASSSYDVRILPKNLLTENSSWKCEGGNLEVLVPHKVVDDGKTAEPCLEVNDNVIEVPEIPFIYKFNKPS